MRKRTSSGNAASVPVPSIWASPEEHLKAAGTGPIGELTFALSTAWVKQASNQTDAAMELLDSPKLPEWAQYYMRYHKALIADVAGRRRGHFSGGQSQARAASNLGARSLCVVCPPYRTSWMRQLTERLEQKKLLQ